MKPSRIIIVRHGESQANIDKSLYETTPDYLMELTEKGREQCFERGVSLKPLIDGKNLTIWTSPYTRCRQTAECILSRLEPAGTRYREDPRLREQDWGNFYTIEDAIRHRNERERHSYFFYRIANGESGADVYDRMSTFLESLHRDFREDDWTEIMLICTHGITALVFLMRFFHWKFEEYENADWFANCDYVIMELDRETGRYRIGVDNRTMKALQN